MKKYTLTAITLHWLMALAIIGMFILGFYMIGLPLSPSKIRLFSWHKWTGVTIFLLAIVRLGWRTAHQPPILPEHMGHLERLAAMAGHRLIYVLMFAIPLSGWLMSSAKGVQTVYFGVLAIPDLLTKNSELGDLLQTAHLSLNVLLIATIVGHAMAALKHHFVDKDDVLVRMLPGDGKR
jgi:cytochrome b561